MFTHFMLKGCETQGNNDNYKSFILENRSMTLCEPPALTECLWIVLLLCAVSLKQQKLVRTGCEIALTVFTQLAECKEKIYSDFM